MSLVATLAALRLGDAGIWGIALALLLGGLAFWLYRRQLRDDAGTLRRILLPTLRAAAVIAIALIIAQPSLYHSRTLRQRGQVILIADTSASMDAPDPQASAAHKLLVASAMNLTDTTGLDWTLHDLAEQVAQLHRAAREGLQSATGDEAPRPETADSKPFSAADFAEETARLAERLAGLDPELLGSADLRGSAMLETWNGIPGRSIAEIARLDVFDRPPDDRQTVDSLRLPEDAGDDFVRRVRGRLHPPESGTYTFHVAADTGAILLLSPDEQVAGVRPILSVPLRTEPDDLSAASPPVALEAGRAYAFEVHHKEGELADHLTVAWSRDGADPVVIAGADLSSPAGLVNPAARRDELVVEFNEQVSQPAAALRDLAPEAIPDNLALIADALASWESELRDLFEAFAADQVARGAPAAVAAVAAFDAMTRSQRRDRIISPPDPVASLAAGLKDSADIELRNTGQKLSEAAENGPATQPSDPERGTDLAAALQAVEPDEDRPQAVVLLSDGRHNAAAPPAGVAAALGHRGVPVYPVLIGSPLPPPDLAVLEVVGPSAVHKEDQVTGRIVLMDAMPPGSSFTLKVTDGDATLWEEDLETTGRGRREIEFAFRIDEAAELRLPPETRGMRLNELLLPLRVEADAVEGEMQERNNEGDLPVRVTLSTGRLLIIDGRPRWDTRYLASILGRDRRWQVSQMLGPAVTRGQGGQTLPRGEGGFPRTREELFEYDVIVLGEVPVGWWREEELDWLADFVDERGGGLIVVDGTRGWLLDYADTPVGKLLPVMREEGTPLAIEHLELTPIGQQRDALRLEPESARNAELWPTLDAPRRVMPASVLPGGEVLLEALAQDGTRYPAIVTGRFGRGRVWYQSFDETWRWRKDAENRWQSRYWSGVANRIMEPPFAAEDRFVSLGVEQAAVELGEAVAVRARLRDEEGRPLTGDAAQLVKATAVLLRDGTPVADARLEPDASGGGLYRADIKAPDTAGVYEVAVTADRYSDADLTARASLLVRKPAATGELARLDADEALMRRLAEASGGRFLSEHEASSELPKLLSGLHRSTTITSEYEIWTSWPLFGAAIGLLGIEWLIRRRTGLH